ncbi:chitinase-3-like protein 1 [Aplysia californica]|uniref:Chitinase-3-like protein 1 n=1 Tax=Aplysia californica TaxID=6500 RepID=A0ABM1VQJ5_APLCA|nr:chitinase-3-like protein 1 [Aplysia californica]
MRCFNLTGFALAAFVLCMNTVSSNAFLRVCYYTSWSRHRTSELSKFDIGDIDPTLCSHLIYAFAEIDKTKMEVVAGEPAVEENKADGSGRYQQFNALKEKHPTLKTLLSIGGEHAGSDKFIAVTSTETIAKRFAATTVDFLKAHGFDGLDVDWEYPTPNTKQTYVTLLKVLREAFDAANPKPLLFVATAAGKWTIDGGYDVEAVARYVDIASIMTYDYHVIGSKLAGFNSPLFSRNDPRFHPALSVNYTVHYWHQLGLPYNKMAVGVTGMGRRYILVNASDFNVGAPVKNQSLPGSLYKVVGGLAYPEVCQLLRQDGTQKFFDSNQKVPYAVHDYDWVGYEDPDSAQLKVKYMIEMGVAGWMFWSLDQDDFTGKACNNQKYPILRVMNFEAGLPAPTDGDNNNNNNDNNNNDTTNVNPTDTTTDNNNNNNNNNNGNTNVNPPDTTPDNNNDPDGANITHSTEMWCLVAIALISLLTTNVLLM